MVNVLCSLQVQGMMRMNIPTYSVQPRDLYDEEKAVAAFRTNDGIFSTQQEHMEGKHGSLLKVINKHDGKEISSVELPYMPTWDGMITANGKVYMTTSDGHVVCFEVK